jgi:hypothetical protein
MIKAGSLPCLRVGRLIRIPIAAVERAEACQPNPALSGSEAATPGTSETASVVILRARRTALKLSGRLNSTANTDRVRQMAQSQ